jgi:CheY-like chemotaxis protein
MEALRLLELKDGPLLAVLDWMMPGIDGVEVCRIIRKNTWSKREWRLLRRIE